MKTKTPIRCNCCTIVLVDAEGREYGAKHKLNAPNAKHFQTGESLHGTYYCSTCYEEDGIYIEAMQNPL